MLMAGRESDSGNGIANRCRNWRDGGVWRWQWLVRVVDVWFHCVYRFVKIADYLVYFVEYRFYFVRFGSVSFRIGKFKIDHAAIWVVCVPVVVG
jgi:hypothetical protein